MVAVLDRELVTTAFIPWLAAQTGRGVGDGQSPPGSPAPYYVVYAIGGGRFAGPAFAAPNADADAVYQVSSVAIGREQAEWAADKARHVLLDRNANGSLTVAFPAIDGWVVYDRSPDSGPPPAASDGAGLWRVDERFVLSITPA